MIYVCGTALTVEQLPLSDTLRYSIVNEKAKIAATVNMGLRKSDVVRCYLNSEYASMRIPDEHKGKVVYFNDDNELIRLCGSSNTATVEAQVAAPAIEEPEDVTEVNASAEEVEAIQEQLNTASDNNEFEAPKAPEPTVDADVTEVEEFKPDVTAMYTPSEDEIFEADMLRAQLKTAEGVLQQNRDRLRTAIEDRDNVYDIAVQELETQAKEYEEKLQEAQEVIAKLKAKIEESSEDTGALAPFNVYAEKSRAVIKTGITLTSPVNNIVAVTSGSADSTATLYQSVALLAMSGYDGYILDLTGDPVFGITLTNLACKMRFLAYQVPPAQLTQEDYAACSLDVQKDLVNWLRQSCDLESCCHSNFANSRVGITGYFNDISLLPMAWDGLLHSIAEATKGRRVLLILPSITSFVGRYLASFLSTGIPVNVATTCAPSALYSVQMNLNAIPANRVRILAMNYIKLPATDALLSGNINTKFAVQAFQANTLFSISQPTREDVTQNMQNNNKIWSTAFQAGR